MKAYLLPEDAYKAILSYLYGRPYNEVHQGVRVLQALTEAPAELGVNPNPTPALESKKEE